MRANLLGESLLLVGNIGLGEQVGVLLQRRLLELGLEPEVGRKEAVGVGQGLEGGLNKVTEGTRVPGGRGVAVLDTSHLQNLLGGASGDDSYTQQHAVSKQAMLGLTPVALANQ